MKTIVLYTMMETLRKRLVVASTILSVLFLLLYGLLLSQMGQSVLPQGNQFEGLSALYLGLFAGYVLIALFSVISVAPAISNELEDGTLLAIVPRPMSRATLVLGKWLGIFIIIVLYSGIIFFGIVGIDRWRFGLVTGGWPAIWAAYGDFVLEGFVASAAALLGSVVTSTLATGIMVSSLVLTAFLGGALQQMSAALPSAPLFRDIGLATELMIPTDALYRRALFQILGSHVLLGLVSDFGPFGVAVPPGPVVVVYAVVYGCALLAVAVRWFQRRDL